MPQASQPSGEAGTDLESMLFIAVRKLLVVADVSPLTLAWYTLHSPQSLLPRSLSPLLENGGLLITR